LTLTSPLYWSPMRALYGRAYDERYRVVGASQGCALGDAEVSLDRIELVSTLDGCAAA